MKGIIAYSYLLLFLFMLGCDSYERHPNCDLDSLNITGDVKRIETIVNSTIPLTEMFYATYSPDIVISSSDGNYCIDFDNHGFISRYIGYGVDGCQVFKVKPSKIKRNVFPALEGSSEEEMQGLYVGNTKRDSANRIVEVVFCRNGEKVYISQIHYNIHGDVDYIAKKYVSHIVDGFGGNSPLKNVDFNQYDTTFYHYQKFDERDNWIEAVVEYKGVLLRHSFVYNVKRRITYNGASFQPALIKQLDEYKDVQKVPISKMRTVILDGMGYMAIPIYMKSSGSVMQAIEGEMRENGTPIKYICMYQYEGKDAYATFSITSMPSEYAPDYDSLNENELLYDKSLDDYIKEVFSANLAQSGVTIFKWLPYKFVNINGILTLCASYYRLGMGGPVPVYVETYQLKGRDGRAVSITLSYQSNHFSRFHDDFEASVKSISLN